MAKFLCYKSLKAKEFNFCDRYPNASAMPNTSNAEDINILLLGETGVGKSTFINAFANFMAYDTLEEGEKAKEIISLIPSRFTVYNDNFELKTVKIGDVDEDENDKVGESATQNCKTYVFPYEDYNIRIIDTPGIGDTRGVDKDKMNFDNLMAFLSQHEELHAILILMKPNQARLTAMFEFCLKQLLSQLQKSATQNILFIFTNSRSTFYTPGETLGPLKKMIDDIAERPPHARIPLNKDTLYCLDNESVRFLMALQCGIKFTNRQKADFNASWKQSSVECIRLMKRIIGGPDDPGLEPHKIQETISINQARRQIINLQQPIGDISRYVQDNILALEKHRQLLKTNATQIERLEGQLFVPELDLIVTALPNPATICTHRNCVTQYVVRGVPKWHYKQRCHEKCFLENVSNGILGDHRLRRCEAMYNTGMCRKCPHDYRTHMHVYYTSQVVENKKEDEKVKQQLDYSKRTCKTVEEIILRLEERQSQYQEEMATLTKANAKFAHFLKTNAITSYNDSFEDYIKHLIENEKVLSKDNKTDNTMVVRLETVLNDYCKEKEVLERVIGAVKDSDEDKIKSDDIVTIIEELFALKLIGKTIKDIHQKSEMAMLTERFKLQVVFVPLGQKKRLSARFQDKVETIKKWINDDGTKLADDVSIANYQDFFNELKKNRMFKKASRQ